MSIERALGILANRELTKEIYLVILHSVQIFRELRNLNPPIPKIMKTRIGFEYKFLENSWKFLSTSPTEDTLRSFLMVLLQPRPTKHYLVKGLSTLDVNNAESLANDFLVLHQEQLMYKKPQQAEAKKDSISTPQRSVTSVASSRAESLYSQQWEKQEKIAVQKRLKLQEEMKDCTFKPNLVAKTTKQRASTDITDRLYSLRNAPKNISDARTSIDKELELCSFHPFVPYK